jgi:hypothetical protein
VNADSHPGGDIPAAPKLPLQLYEKLGKEAMTDLANWFADMDARHQAEMKEFRTVIEDLKATDARLEAEMKAGFAELKAQIVGVQAELIKWTFVFWLGTVGIVVMLIRFLNHSPG